MMRSYRVHVPAGPPVTVDAARIAIEAGGSLVAYGTPTGVTRERIVAAFAPAAWLRVEVLT